MTQNSCSRQLIRLMDIAPNLTDPMFQGIYRGKKVHDSDLHLVLDRAKSVGIYKMMITGSSLNDAKTAYDLVKNYNAEHVLYSTVGCHPCHATDFEDPIYGGPETYVKRLSSLIQTDIDNHKNTGMERKIIAIGECGLDFDREDYCPKEIQIKHYEKHFDLTEQFNMPMFLHDRNTGGLFYEMTRKNRHRFPTGVVHSFTGTMDEMKKYISDLDLYIGINGCSLKTEENLDVVREIPLNRLMLETDAPWCEIRPSHASHKYLNDFDYSIIPDSKKKEKFEMGKSVRSRCEPCHIRQVLHVIARLKGISDTEVAEHAWNNTESVFFNNTV